MSNSIRFPIVGMQFRPKEGIPAPIIMSLLPPGSPLYLVRDPNNPHDPNAIQVWIKDVASVIPESLGDIREACILPDGSTYECPDLSQPLMLGFIKAKTISEEVQGSDELAPKIDALLAAGSIESESEIPCELVYGESGKPALKIKEGTSGTPDGANSEAAGEMNAFEEDEDEEESEFSEGFEADRDFLSGEFNDSESER